MPFPTQYQKSGSQSYSNADLKDRQKLGITTVPNEAQNVDYQDPYANEPSVDEILAGAKDFLGRPDVTNGMMPSHAPQGSTGANIPVSLRSLTDAARVGGSLGLEGVESSPTASWPVKGAAMLGKYAVPTYAVPLALSGLQQLIAPEADQSRISGAIDTAMGGGAAFATGKAALGALRRPLIDEALDPAAESVRETVNTARNYLQKGQADAYERSGNLVGTDITRAQASQRAGWPLGESEATTIRQKPQVPENRPLNVKRPASLDALQAELPQAEAPVAEAPAPKLARGGTRTPVRLPENDPRVTGFTNAYLNRYYAQQAQKGGFQLPARETVGQLRQGAAPQQSSLDALLQMIREGRQ